MNQQTIDQRMSRYQNALAAGEITEAEFEGFMEGVRQAMAWDEVEAALQAIEEALKS